MKIVSINLLLLFDVVLASSSKVEGGESLALKIIPILLSALAFIFTIYVVYLGRKVQKDKEFDTKSAENLELRTNEKIAALRSEITNNLAELSTTFVRRGERIKQIETILEKTVETSAVRSFQYNVDTDLADIKKELERFRDHCSNKHDKLSGLPTLKDRVDEIYKQIGKLEDFRHNSADRYVLMVNYQQDVRMLTDAIGVLRVDLRAVMEMVDKL